MANVTKYVGDRRIGLVTNPSAVDSRLRSTLDLLAPTGQLSAFMVWSMECVAMFKLAKR